MKHEELLLIANTWLEGWNKRDLKLLLSMINENSRLASIHSFFDPIFLEGTVLKDKNYLLARFKRDIDILESSGLYFQKPNRIKTGDFFVDMEYQMSNNLYVHEILSLSETGLIDQVYRSIDSIAFS